MELFVCILVIGGMAYSLLVSVIIVSLSRVRSGMESRQPMVSVVIAARNEAANIGSCLESLQSQDYPPDRYEIVVADDRSTDDTPAILRRWEEKWGNLRILSIERAPEGISPKKKRTFSRHRTGERGTHPSDRCGLHCSLRLDFGYGEPV